MDSRDIALQGATPTVMVPRFGDLEELQHAGRRILMAGNGVWQEIRRAWVYSRAKVGLQLPVAVPYGDVTEALRFTFGKLPTNLVREFIELARERSPNECAAWVTWNSHSNEWKLMMLEEKSVSTGHVTSILPKLVEGEHLVLDLHSHGITEAFFSRTDNADDKGEVKIAGVVGSLNQPEATTAFRFCANGLFVPLPFKP